MKISSFILVLTSFLLVGFSIHLAKTLTQTNITPQSLDCSDCNVVLISVDTLRADRLGTYGYPRNTSPNIDKLARNSLVFDQAFSQGSSTEPGHLAVLASRHMPSLVPYTAKIPDYTWSSAFFMKDYPQLENIAERLQKHDYTTGAVVAGGLMRPSLRWGKGFAFYEEAPELFAKKTSAEEVNKIAFKWLDAHANQKFFLFVHYLDVHCPYVAPTVDEFEVESPEQESSKLIGNCAGKIGHRLSRISEQERKDTLKGISDRYDATIHYVDSHVGQLLNKLEQLGVNEKTLIVLLADHGEEIGDHAFAPYHQFFDRGVVVDHTTSMFNEVLHVPLIIYHPHVAPQRIPYHVGLIDVAPTVLDMLSIPIPTQFEGKSLIPFFNGHEKAHRDVFSASMHSRVHPYKTFVLISGNLKYIFAYKGDFKIFREYLYNLTEDPGEQIDLAQLHPKQTWLLHSKLLRWLEQMRQKGESFQRQLQLQERKEAAEESTNRLPESLRSLGYVH